jgi:putative ABC transport system permease protein
VPELAVLKTLGFSDGTVLGFVLAEAGALVLFGGAAGMVAATGLGALISSATGGQFELNFDSWVWTTAAIAIVVMSLAVGLLPALRARRLKIVDALAGR